MKVHTSVGTDAAETAAGVARTWAGEVCGLLPQRSGGTPILVVPPQGQGQLQFAAPQKVLLQAWTLSA